MSYNSSKAARSRAAFPIAFVSPSSSRIPTSKSCNLCVMWYCTTLCASETNDNALWAYVERLSLMKSVTADSLSFDCSSSRGDKNAWVA